MLFVADTAVVVAATTAAAVAVAAVIDDDVAAAVVSAVAVRIFVVVPVPGTSQQKIKPFFAATVPGTILSTVLRTVRGSKNIKPFFCCYGTPVLNVYFVPTCTVAVHVLGTSTEGTKYTKYRGT